SYINVNDTKIPLVEPSYKRKLRARNMVRVKNDPDIGETIVQIGTSQRTKQKRKSNERSWLCKNCGVKFDNRKDMVAHRNEIHIDPYETLQQKYSYDKQEDVYTCKHCDFESPKKELIKEHILEHEQKFECAECKEAFYSAYKFCVHVRKHGSEEMYQCPLCIYSTNRRTSVVIHINTIHLQKYLYYCQFCGKGFHDSVTLKEHENNHLG
ncbi:zinc finger protein, partial [Oryctes borbonicus]